MVMDIATKGIYQRRESKTKYVIFGPICVILMTSLILTVSQLRTRTIAGIQAAHASNLGVMLMQGKKYGSFVTSPNAQVFRKRYFLGQFVCIKFLGELSSFLTIETWSWK